MMNTLGIFVVLINTICILTTNDAAPVQKGQQQQQHIIMRGRVTFPGGSKTRIESGAQLTVELQDTSLADAPAKVIAKGTGKAVRFPMAFAVKYFPAQVQTGVTYTLSVTIKNKQNELLYINDVQIIVIPLGVGRTKFIDVPVIRVKQTTPTEKKKQWPELVGKKGDEAVKIIKKESGFTNVVIVKAGSAVTLDYRTDRVRVFVDDKGIVTSAPTVG